MKVVVVHSGGLDSTVLLYEMRAAGHEIKALSIDYGQRHRVELRHAAQVAERLGVEHRVVDLSSLSDVLGGSSLTSAEVAVAEGHYEEDSMKSTVVPNRNMILLSVAVGWALSLHFEAVAYAAHGGDHAIYPDCRPEFAEALAAAVRLADWQNIELLRPFVSASKTDIVRRGAELQVPFIETWSCYKGGAVHCGRCGTCIERREAFHLAGVDDPTVYAEDAPDKETLIRCGWRPQLQD